MKKIVSLLLIFVILFMLEVNSFAKESSCTDDGFVYENGADGITVTGYVGGDENLNIPETIDGEKVVSVASGAFAGNSKIKVVGIPKYVTDVGAGAFNDCVNITNINIYAMALNAFSPEGTFNRVGTANDSGTGVTFGKEVSTVPDHFLYSPNISDAANIAGVTFAAFKSSGFAENAGSVNPWRSYGVTIGKKAFGNCTLKSIFFYEEAPESIAEDAFENAELKITYQEAEPTWQAFDKKRDYGGKIIWEASTLAWSQNKPEFTDVPDDAYYKDPVLWAVQFGVTAGTGNGKFSPNAQCTRAQAVMFLWKAKRSPEPKTTDNPFKDVKETDYFYKAVLWAFEEGITAGTGNNTFSPNAPCSRGQIITFIWRAWRSPVSELKENPFTDIGDGDYWKEAVLWSYENGITFGMAYSSSEFLFSPNRICTRAQIITFLFKASSRI